jgi:signal transduction histidine kinase
MFVCLLRRYFNLGVTPGMQILHSQRIRLTNTLSIIPLLVYAYYFGYGIYFKVMPSIIMAGSFFFISLGAIVLNARKKYGVAKFLILTCCAFSTASSHNAFDIGESQLFLFFPILLVMLILFDINEEKIAVTASLVSVLGCLVSALLMPRFYFYKEELTPDLVVLSKWLCYIISFGVFIICVFVIQKNINKTLGKLIEAREVAEDANKAKSQFLSNMSHELRTPLNGIIGSTNLLLQGKHDEQQKSYFDILQFSSDHMLHLIEDILTFSKGEAGKIKLEQTTFHLQSTLHKITGVFEPQFQKNGVLLHRQFDDIADVYICSDELRLSQVLNNLLSNALKFTRRGSVAVVVKALHTSEQQVQLYFEIQDTGVGIKKENIASIFDSFTQAETGTTRKYGGAGLGLSISKQLLHLFGSELKVESEYKVGSKFFFEMNVQKADRPFASHTVTSIAKQGLQQLKVLAAEDNSVNMMVLSKLLAKWDVQLTKAVNGVQLVELFSRDQYDVLLIDLEMPEMDGYTALKKIRIMDQNIPAYAFSAAVYENIEDDLLQKGFTGFIPKPFKQEDLYQKLESVKTLSAKV